MEQPAAASNQLASRAVGPINSVGIDCPRFSYYCLALRLSRAAQAPDPTRAGASSWRVVSPTQVPKTKYWFETGNKPTRRL
jgi:hypothetical protein